MPISGATESVDPALGYHKGNRSPLPRFFLSQADELVARVTRAHHP